MLSNGNDARREAEMDGKREPMEGAMAMARREERSHSRAGGERW